MPASDQNLAYSKNRYHLVPRTLTFVTSRDEVLLLKGAPTKKIWSGKYNGLGGHVERGESIHAAAEREILEEAGLKVSDLWLKAVITIDANQSSGIGLYVFTAAVASRNFGPSPEGALEWVPLSRLSQLDLVEDLPTLLPVVLSRRLYDPPFSAHYRWDANDQLVIEFSGLTLAPCDQSGRVMEVGDWVRLVAIPPGVKQGPRETRAIFRRALGQTFKVQAFDEYGHAELDLSRKVARLNTIWVEPGYLGLHRRKRKSVKPRG